MPPWKRNCLLEIFCEKKKKKTLDKRRPNNDVYLNSTGFPLIEFLHYKLTSSAVWFLSKSRTIQDYLRGQQSLFDFVTDTQLLWDIGPLSDIIQGRQGSQKMALQWYLVKVRTRKKYARKYSFCVGLQSRQCCTERIMPCSSLLQRKGKEKARKGFKPIDSGRNIAHATQKRILRHARGIVTENIKLEQQLKHRLS